MLATDRSLARGIHTVNGAIAAQHSIIIVGRHGRLPVEKRGLIPRLLADMPPQRATLALGQGARALPAHREAELALVGWLPPFQCKTCWTAACWHEVFATELFQLILSVGLLRGL